MSKPMIRIHNVETNEIIDREMNDKEYKTYLISLENQKLIEIEAKAKSDAKIELLAKLGITDDEAKLLLS